MTTSLINRITISLAYRIRLNQRLLSRYSLSSSAALPANSPATSAEGVHMTDSCVKRMKELQTSEASAEDKVLRLSVEAGGCSGFQYAFSLDDKTNPDDRIFEKDGVKLAVDKISYDFVKGASVDYVEELIRSAFQVTTNPSVVGGCSCRSSFMMVGPNFKRIRRGLRAEASVQPPIQPPQVGNNTMRNTRSRAAIQPPVQPPVQPSAQPPVQPSSQPSAQPPVQPSAQPPVHPSSSHNATSVQPSMSSTSGTVITSTPASLATFEEEEAGDDSSNILKNVRGVCRGLNLDEHVKRYGKVKIIFNPLEKSASTPESDWLLAEGVGVSVRTCADVVNSTRWKNVSPNNKEVVRARLLQWFDIEDWTSSRVQSIINELLQSAYRHWRNTLNTCYKRLKEKGLDVRENSPRDELTLEEWKKVCDWLESDAFQSRSSINSTNRGKLPYSHTSGKIKYQSRLKKMDEPSKVRNWKNNHLNKTGEFVNPNAKRAYDTMMDLEDSYNDSMTEDEILAKALGERSGYQKGLGYGVEVPRRNASWTTSQEDSTIHEKLSETERNLESANGSIQTLTMELEEEKSKRKEYEERLEEFQAQMLKMQQMMEMMQTERNGI